MSSIVIGGIRAARSGSSRALTADVRGVDAWFDSPDLDLAPAPEAFAGMFLLPALHHHLALRPPGPLDPTWAIHAERIAAIAQDWWGYRKRIIESGSWPREHPASSAGDAAPATAALFFSGGVDSFHELLRGEARPEWLVTLQGFDFRIEDRVRAAVVESSVREVAAERRVNAAVVRTNAREHPLIDGMPWERAHGGVLGAIAHLLRPVARRVTIAASAPGDREIPWGSHWRIDPLWSSSLTTVTHGGRGVRRIDKLRGIAHEPLIAEHLRVCWRNLAPAGNCSRCTKCVLAMLILEDCGALARSKVFEGREALAARIDALRKTPDRIAEFDELSRSPRLDPDVTRAARSLVRRSRRLQRPDIRFRRTLVRWYLRWRGTPDGPLTPRPLEAKRPEH